MNIEKLNQRDYPKLQEQMAMRVNQTASLHSIPATHGNTPARNKKAFGHYEPRERLENEAVARSSDWRQGEPYRTGDGETRVGGLLIIDVSGRRA